MNYILAMFVFAGTIYVTGLLAGFTGYNLVAALALGLVFALVTFSRVK